MIFKPATPGFLVTLIATILLAVVSFSVPWIKSVFFLQANVDFDGHNGTATFGVLGYCLHVGGTVNCTSPRIGYEFDPNALLGNKTPIQIPEVVVKWLTYALVLHIVALVFAAGSAVFGLLAHVREMSMTCCSTCVSGFGAAIALIAFIFDIAFFFLAKARINKVPGGSAQIGNAIWLTLAAWLLLFFAGCFYSFGRCCISNRPRGSRDKQIDPTNNAEAGRVDMIRLDAVKAEADRKARQKQGEMGLPAFDEYDPSKPLTAKYNEEDEPYTDNRPSRRPSNFSNLQDTGYAAPINPGYISAPVDAPTMDTYNAISGAAPLVTAAAAVTTYPPQPQAHIQQPSMQQSTYGNVASPPTHAQYPSTNGYDRQQPSNTQYDTAYGHGQYPSNDEGNLSYNNGQFPSIEGTYGQGQYLSAGHGDTPYSHYTQATSYYSTTSQYPETFQNPEASSYTAGGYAPQNATAYNTTGPSPPSINYGGNSQQQQTSPSQFLTSTAALSMGRDDYTFSRNAQPSHSPPPLNITSNQSRQISGPRGPRSPTSPTAYSQQTHSDMPPGYESGSQAAMWQGEKR